MDSIKKNLLVSIITPTYNRASFLEETINSILNQDYKNIEYIIIDDGSTDNTQEILNKYKDKVIIYSQKNRGEAAAVNKGFSLAKGEIIGVINSDDPLYHNAVSEIVNFFLQNRDISAVYPNWNMINENGKIIQKVDTFEYDFINMLRWHHCIPGPGAFFKSEVVEILKGRDESFKYVGDFDFWLRAGLYFNFKKIPKVLASFRVHKLSTTIKSKGNIMAEERIKLMDKIYSFPNLSKNILMIKREAYGSAFFVAAVSIGSNNSIFKYFYILKSIFLCPFKYFKEYQYILI